MKRRATLIVSFAALLTLGPQVGCDDGAVDSWEPEGIGIMTANLAPCTSSENADRQFPSGSDRVVFEISGGSIGTPPLIKTVAKEDATGSGEAVVAGVPPGAGMNVDVAACSGSQLVWAGQARDVDVAASQKSFASVFLTKAGGVACTGNALSAPGAEAMAEGRAFAVTSGGEEAAWIIGGFSDYTPSTRKATATSSIDMYTRLTSEFTPAGQLSSARAMALGQELSDGRVRIVGGTTELYLARVSQPALSVDAASAPTSASEILDPVTGSVTPDASEKIAALPALAAMDGDRVLGIGGITEGASAGESVTSTELFKIDSTGLTRFDTGVARFGATLVALSGDTALVWGGNVGAAPSDIAALVSAIDAIETSVTPLTVTGTTTVPIYAAGIALAADASGNPRALIAGGNRIDAGGVFPPSVTSARLQVVTIDVGAATASVVDIDRGGEDAAFTRALPVMARLDEGELWLFGGYTAFSTNPFCPGANDCIQPGMMRFDVTGLDGTPALSVMGSPLELSVGPLGAVPVSLSDRSWLIVGGIAAISDTEIAPEAALVRYHGFETDLCAVGASGQ